MNKLIYTLTALFTTSLLISCVDSSSSTSSSKGSWSSEDTKACVEGIISNPDLEMDDFNELGIDPKPIAKCMCGVFEKEFDSWGETGSTVWEDEWAINNEMLALEAAGCLFNALGDMDLGDVDLRGLINEDFNVDFDAELNAEFDEAMEELDAAMGEFDEAMEELDNALEDFEW